MSKTIKENQKWIRQLVIMVLQAFGGIILMVFMLWAGWLTKAVLDFDKRETEFQEKTKQLLVEIGNKQAQILEVAGRTATLDCAWQFIMRNELMIKNIEEGKKINVPMPICGDAGITLYKD